MNQATRAYTRRLLQCLTVAVRPLRLSELAEILAFDFDDAPGGIPSLNSEWRQEDKERTVLSTCSSLITIVPRGSYEPVVQFSHFSVKEFLTSDRLTVAAEGISFYHIVLEPAHTILAQACLGILLRLDDCNLDTAEQFPLAVYALEHWVDHALFENVSVRVKHGIEELFDASKPHFLQWIQLRGDLIISVQSYVWQDASTQNGAAPIYFSAFCGFHDVLEKLIREHPEHVNTIGGHFGTALHAASRMNHLKVVQSLLRHGADVNALGKWGKTPLLFASELGHLEVVRWLLEHGADVNAMENDPYNMKRTALGLAIFVGHYEIVRTLLEHNADVRGKNVRGWTPLHLASDNGRVDILRLLLNHGADPNARGVDQQTSLHLASSEGHLDSVRLLLEHGAEVDAEDDKGRTAYQSALGNGHDEVVQLLLAYGTKSRT